MTAKIAVVRRDATIGHRSSIRGENHRVLRGPEVQPRLIDGCIAVVAAEITMVALATDVRPAMGADRRDIGGQIARHILHHGLLRLSHLYRSSHQLEDPLLPDD